MCTCLINFYWTLYFSIITKNVIEVTNYNAFWFNKILIRFNKITPQFLERRKDFSTIIHSYLNDLIRLHHNFLERGKISTHSADAVCEGIYTYFQVIRKLWSIFVNTFPSRQSDASFPPVSPKFLWWRRNKINPVLIEQ